MEILFVLLLAVAFASLTGWNRRSSGRRARRRLADSVTRTVARAARAFWDFNAANVRLWEDYVQAQRPWELLHWVPTSEGWQLEGTKLPRTPAGCSRRHDGDR